MPVLKLMRVQDWVKNLFVLLPIVFWLATPKSETGALSAGEVVLLALLAFMAFSLVSSSVYCFNDALDAEKDRTHPVKRLRPVASGQITAASAFLIGILLALSGLFLGFLTGYGVLVVLGIYLLLQILYNGGAKYVVLVDVVVIALGFTLRAAAGALAIDDRISIWLLLCVFFLCLYLGFIKRLCDHSSAEREKSSEWKSPAGYDSRMELNWLLGVSAVLSVMMYLTYALSPHARELFGVGASGIALLSPFVLIVMHRFYRRASEGLSDSPLQALVSDRMVQIGVFFFFAGVIACLYSPMVRGLLEKLLIT
ncbi:MAG: UbiA prenyltransferase family protein [Phycisphaerales bacterium]|nr:UbiA prenyltransferase family protein [Phycisphaerales bacterium]